MSSVLAKGNNSRLRTQYAHLSPIVLAALSISNAPPAFANAEPEEESRANVVSTASASELFQQGLDYVNQGEFQASIEAFKKANQVQPHFTVWYNIAKSHQLLGQSRLAIHCFERYLEEGESRISSDERAQVQGLISTHLRELLEEVEDEQLGNAPPLPLAPHTLALVGVPSHATVTLDGAPWPAGGALSAGTHYLGVTGYGFYAWRRTLDLTAGKHSTVTVQLQPIPAPAPGVQFTKRDLKRARDETLGYALGGAGLVLVATAAATYFWNQSRHNDWKKERQQLLAEPDATQVSKDILTRQVNNNARLAQIRAFQVVWISSGIAAAGLFGTASYFLFSRDTVEQAPTQHLMLSPTSIAWNATW